MTNTYELRDERSRNLLSEHPNREGARISALRHVKNGDAVAWEVGPNVEYGLVNGERQFVILAS